MSQAIAVGTFVLVLALVGCSQAAGPLLVSDLPAAPAELSVQLSADDLYAGFEAHRAVRAGNAVALDARNWSVGGLPGRLVTDVIDLGSGAVVSLPVKISNLKIALDADSPEGSRVELACRHGATFFQTDGWTDWQPVAPGKAIDIGDHRYLQLRIELVSDKPAVVPAVRSVTIACTRAAVKSFARAVEVTDAAVQRIVRSPIVFGYERMDQPDLAWFRASAKLDDVIAGKKSEMDKLIALCLWVAQRNNIRGEEASKRMGKPYPWNIRKVFDPAVSGGTIYGHCGSYCEVLVTAACALGWQGRHIADLGNRENSHETAEVWVDELGKWVYLDPSLSTWYTDKKTGVPLNSLEMHNVLINEYLRDGETVRDLLGRGSKSFTARRRAEVDPNDFSCKMNTYDFTYGEKKPFDWTTKQGLMTKGFMQMTPRNNFHSQPEPALANFGAYPLGHNGFPYWTDARTPLYDAKTRNWYTRPRDWYWTLNQASFRLVRTADDAIEVECGNSQPHFDHYRVAVNGKERTEKGRFAWRLAGGANTLQVVCVDAMGQKGIPSSVTVVLKD